MSVFTNCVISMYVTTEQYSITFSFKTTSIKVSWPIKVRYSKLSDNSRIA